MIAIFRKAHLGIWLGLGACVVELPSGGDEGGSVGVELGSSSTTAGMPSDGEPTSAESTGDGASTGDGESSDGESSDGDDSSGSDEFTFIPPSDVTGCSCDPFAQDCPEGEKCVPYASTGMLWNSTKCVEVTGDGQLGEPCSSGGLLDATDSCGADLVCWDLHKVEGEWAGVCTAFCTPPADLPSCPEGSTCMIMYEGSAPLCIADPVPE